MKALKCSFLCLMFFTLVCVPGASAQALTGNTYNCYMLSTLDIVNTGITFGERGVMVLSSYTGNGFYFTLTDSFMGSYWSLDQTIGLLKGDLLFILYGTSNDPFLYGWGVLIFEYSDVHPLIFFGSRQLEE